jgi:hypothetical protein
VVHVHARVGDSHDNVRVACLDRPRGRHVDWRASVVHLGLRVIRILDLSGFWHATRVGDWMELQRREKGAWLTRGPSEPPHGTRGRSSTPPT